jgi:hypothetical protein
MDTHTVGDHLERFLLRTYLRKTTETRDSTGEKEENLIDKEYSESAREEEVGTEELHWEEPETPGTMPTV